MSNVQSPKFYVQIFKWERTLVALESNSSSGLGYRTWPMEQSRRNHFLGCTILEIFEERIKINNLFNLQMNLKI